MTFLKKDIINIVKKIVLVLFLLTVLCLGFLPVKDTDFGWHYRCGNQFLETGNLCLSNTFSYFLPNYKAYYSGHLYDIALALVYNHGGFLLVSIIGAVIFSLSALVFFLLIRSESWISISAFFIVFFLSYPIFNLGLRPQIVSYLFFLFLLFILKHKNLKLLFTLPFLFLLWVNIHIGFFIGLFILFFYLFKQKKRTLIPYIGIIFLSLLATLINPFGLKVYEEIFKHASSPLNTMIAEWVQPTLWQAVFIIIISIVSFTIMVKNKTITLTQFLLLFFFGVLVLKAQRNLPFFYTIFFIIFLNKLKIKSENLNGILVPLLSSVIFFTVIVHVPSTILHGTHWNTYCNNSITVAYPCAALKKYPLSGNVYANYEWGGFLIWQKPEIKVFVDGRMPAWKDENDKSPYQVYLEIIQIKSGWNEKLRSLKTDYIFINAGTFLDLLLQKNTSKFGWKEEYRDNFAVIYKNIVSYVKPK